MELTWITFVGLETGSSVPLPAVTVTLWNQHGALILQKPFALSGASGGASPFTIEGLPPGEYVAAARADGYKFNFPISVEVPDQSAEPTTANDPKIFNLVAESSLGTTSGPVCRVTGTVPQPSPNSRPGTKVQEFGVPIRVGDATVVGIASFSVVFEVAELVHEGVSPTLAAGDRTRVSPDRHGYFEVYLRPDTLYRLHMPHVSGVRYLRTPDAGESADVETLIQEVSSLSVYDL